MPVRFFKDVIETTFVPEDLVQFGEGLAFGCKGQLLVSENLIPLRGSWSVADALEKDVLGGETVEGRVDDAVRAFSQFVK